jgi:uncharacterized protein (DUF1697 family)
MKTSRFVVLLRGINVGGKNKLPMKALALLLCREGLTNVRTYLQSCAARACPAFDALREQT